MENPNFYAIIPADIRYSKELSMFQKLLYAEITALTQKDGYCWASNKYFAELYDMGETYISKQISDLAKKGFLEVFIEKEKGNLRKIYVGKIAKASGKTVSARPIAENNKTYCEKVQYPYCTKVQENNININNKNNKEKNIKKEIFGELENVKLSLEEKNKLIENYGEIKTNEFIEKLSLYLESKGDKYKSHYATILTWMRKENIPKIQKAKTNFTDLL